MSDIETYEEQKLRIADEQAALTREEVADRLVAQNMNVFDPAKATPQGHNLVDRGSHWSCEGVHHHHVIYKKVTPM